MFCAVSLVVFGDTAGKLLGQNEVHPFFIAWSRFFIGFLMLMPFLGSLQANLKKVWHPLLLCRGLVIAAAISSILTALRSEPIANVFGAFFIGPVVAYFFSWLVLREKGTVLRTIMMLAGFSGVLMVVQPGLDFQFGILFAILAGCLYGVYLVLTRRLAREFGARTLLFSQLLWGAIFLLPFGFLFMPDILSENADWQEAQIGWITALIVISALGSAAGNWMIAYISQSTPANIVAPLVYLQLLTATAVGVIVFEAIPDILALIGLLVIFTAGLSSLFLAKRFG